MGVLQQRVMLLKVGLSGSQKRSAYTTSPLKRVNEGEWESRWESSEADSGYGL